MARLSPASVVGRGGTILSVSNDTVGDSPGLYGFYLTNARDVTRKRSLNKEVKSINSSSNVGLDIDLSIEPIQAENYVDVNVPASKRRVISTH